MFETTNRIIIPDILGSIIPNHQPDYITIIITRYFETSKQFSGRGLIIETE